MAVDVRNVIEISRPVAAVAAYAMDPDKAPEWYVNIRAIAWKTSPELRVGARMAFVASFLGRRLAYTYEIVELVPESKLVMRTAEGPFPMETTYTFSAVAEDVTRMELRNRGTPSGFSAIAAPLMAVAMDRANKVDLANIKRLLEADA